MTALARRLRPERTAVPDRILTAARRRFEKYGYRRTGMLEIARDAGIAAGTIYRYFDSKEDIFLRVAETETEGWLATARKVLDEPGTAVERLARLAEASLAYNNESKLFRSVMARDTEIIFAPLLEDLHEHVLSENVAMMAKVIRDGIAEGSIAPIDADKAAYILWITGDALFRHDVSRPYEDVLPVLNELMLNGLLPRSVR